MNRAFHRLVLIGNGGIFCSNVAALFWCSWCLIALCMADGQVRPPYTCLSIQTDHSNNRPSLGKKLGQLSSCLCTMTQWDWLAAPSPLLSQYINLIEFKGKKLYMKRHSCLSTAEVPYSAFPLVCALSALSWSSNGQLSVTLKEVCA